MRICILDGYTTNPGDLSWDPFEKIGEPEVYDFTKPEELLQRASGCPAVITNKTVLSGDVIESLYRSGLRYIGTLSTGYNVIDLETAAGLGIPVCNVPQYCSRAVSQYVFAMILHFANRIALHDESVHAGDWEQASQFCYWKADLTELEGQTLGIIGYGNIGRETASIAGAFGMRALVCTRTQRSLPDHCRAVPLEELLRESDYITLHCPLTEKTREIINRDTISLMKPEVVIINASRGGTVCEQDLADALNSGRIAGAGVDVLSTEPPKHDNPLLHARNCVITPHIAWASREARGRLIGTAAENLKSFLSGSIQNNVVWG